MAKRIRVSVIKSEIDAAIAIAMRLAENRDDFRVGLELKEAEMRINACLDRVEAREALLRKAILACQATAELRTTDKEAVRARSLAREVIGEYGEPGGMHAN